MQRIVTSNDVRELKSKLSNIEKNSEVLNTPRITINSQNYYDSKTDTVVADYAQLEYYDSGISDLITIDNNGAFYLDNNTNEYSPMYTEDCLGIYQAGEVIIDWWKNLPEATN